MILQEFIINIFLNSIAQNISTIYLHNINV